VRRSALDISVPSALDLRDPSAVGLDVSDLLDDGVDAYVLSQAIGAAAYSRGLTGILAPGATAMGRATGDYNVMVFFTLTGATKTVYGFLVPETDPRPGVGIIVHGSEAPDLGAS
jgi:hypothetical protein